MIQVVISDDALDDLNVGFWFYETQQAGMGDYFADKLRNDIETLKQTGGSIASPTRISIEPSVGFFRTRFITRAKATMPLCGRSLIVGVTRIGFWTD